MKKILAILLVLCMVVTFVAACGKEEDTSSSSASTGDSTTSGSTSSDSTPSGSTAGDGPLDAQGEQPAVGDISVRDSVSMAIMEDVGTLNPLYLNGWASQQCIRAIYEPLWSTDNTRRELRWVLATGYEMSEDGLIWTVHLRDDAYFASGHKLTAEDVIFSLYLANHREGEPPWFLYMIDEECKAIDDTTVQFVFSRYMIGYEYSFTSVMIFCKATYDPDTISMETDGTGPYAVADYVIQSHLNLERREDYWGPQPPIKYVNYRFMSEDAQRVNALQTGEIQIGAVPFQDVEYVNGLPNMAINFVSRMQTRAVICNNTNPASPFYDNTDARAAVFYAVNPEPILRMVYNNYGKLAAAPYTSEASDMNPAHFGAGPYANNGYDPDLARQLAESSGLAEWSQNNTLRLINNGTSDMVMTSELVQGMLREIGVMIEILTYDPGSWLTYRFDHTAYEMTVDFSGGTPAASDLGLWWQYCGNNSLTSGNPDPEDVLRLREIVDGGHKDPNDLTLIIPIIMPDGSKMVPVGEMPDPAARQGYYDEMVNTINETFLFKNCVELVDAIGYDEGLVIDLMNNNWINWLATYWKS